MDKKTVYAMVGVVVLAAVLVWQAYSPLKRVEKSHVVKDKETTVLVGEFYFRQEGCPTTN